MPILPAEVVNVSRAPNGSRKRAEADIPDGPSSEFE